MEKLIAYGLENGVFTTRAIARLIYGPIHQRGYWNSRRDEYTEVLAWELPNVTLIPEEERQKLYQKVMMDTCNQDFFTVRALCALGNQQPTEELISEPKDHKFYWQKHYEMTDTIRQGHNVMALSEVRLWHQWGLPFSMEEVTSLQHTIGQNIEYMQEFRDWLTLERSEVLAEILAFETKRVDTSVGYELLKKLPLDIMYEFLIKVYGNIKR